MLFSLCLDLITANRILPGSDEAGNDPFGHLRMTQVENN